MQYFCNLQTYIQYIYVDNGVAVVWDYIYDGIHT